MILLEVNGLGGLVIILFAMMLVPPILLSIIALAIRKSKPKAAKILFILAVVYLIVSLGICGSIT